MHEVKNEEALFLPRDPGIGGTSVRATVVCATRYVSVESVFRPANGVFPNPGHK